MEKAVDCCEHRYFGFGICRDATGVRTIGASRRCSPEHVPNIRCGRIPFDLASKHARHLTGLWTDHIDEVLHTDLVLALFRRSHFEDFIEKAFFGDRSQHLLVISADDELSFAQRLNSRKSAHASLDMLSGPERFLKHVGPQITHLPIAVSRADLTADAQPVTRRSTLVSLPFASLESRFFLSYACRVVAPATRRKFNCTGLVRKSIFGAARYERTTVDHGILSNLQHLKAKHHWN